MKKISVSFLVCLLALPSVCWGKTIKVSKDLHDLFYGCMDVMKEDDKIDLEIVDEVKTDKKDNKKLEKIKLKQDTCECFRVYENEGKIRKLAKKQGIEFDCSSEESIASQPDETNSLYNAMISRKVKATDLCVGKMGDRIGNKTAVEDDCPYINPMFGICDVHEFNIGEEAHKGSSEDRDTIREIVAWKTTVFSQQMYKDYEYLAATLKRIRTQLQKAVLTAKLEMAGAETGRSSSASGRNNSDDKTLFLSGAQNCSNVFDLNIAYSCLQNNVGVIVNNVANNYKNACLQLQTTLASAQTILQTKEITNCDGIQTDAGKSCSASDKQQVTQCAQAINFAVMRKKQDEENEKYKNNNNRY